MSHKYALELTPPLIVPMTVALVPKVVSIHLQAFAGYMNTRIGSRYITSFIEWFIHANQGIALVAKSSSGDVVGYVVGAPLGYERILNRTVLWKAARGLAARPWLLLQAQVRRAVVSRGRVILGVANSVTRPTLSAPTMSLVGIGVAASAQGRGAGLLLMKSFENRARQLDMRSLLLSVYPDNVAARRLYARCGWGPCVQPIARTQTMFYFKLLD